MKLVAIVFPEVLPDTLSRQQLLQLAVEGEEAAASLFSLYVRTFMIQTNITERETALRYLLQDVESSWRFVKFLTTLPDCPETFEVGRSLLLQFHTATWATFRFFVSVYEDASVEHDGCDELN